MSQKINCVVLLAALAGMTLFGCNKSNNSGAPTLIWWQIGSNSADLAHYCEILSDYTEAKIGVRVDIRQGSWSNATQRFNAMINTGEYWDILFSDANSYPSFASLGAYADITQMVKEAAPELYYGIPEELWNGVSLNGAVYGVPTYKDSASTMFAFWDAAVVEKYQLNIQDNSWRNLDANFKKVKAGEGQRYYPYIISKGDIDPVFLRYDTFTSFLHPIGVRSDDANHRVVCTLEQDDVLEAFKYMHHWYETGVINPDANMVETLPKYRPYFIAQAWPSVAASYATSAAIEKYLPSRFYGPVYSTGSIQGSINCISVNSKYKNEALKLLHLVNSDPKFRDMMAYGIEGDHFHYVTMPDGRRAVHRDRNDWPLVNYQEGNYFIETPEDTAPAGYWDEVRSLNESAVPSQLLGFSMDLTPVENEVINCKNTWMKYYTDIRTGASDPDKMLPGIIAELRKKGMDTIIAEAQRQVDEFVQKQSDKE
ncbi:MAG: ABC transporter substrate-binding protein [Treponema sp.]|jgi:putative aldouronate transport system substrate-binding protein|nr:ABC transporter substrate-binding protein [Treponema sp.]